MRALAGLLLGAAMASACGTSGLAFTIDDRVEITAPDDREAVRLPVEIRWRVRGDAGERARFAVFVDREPIRPGQHLDAVGDGACRRRKGCPDAAYLRDRYVFVTSRRRLLLDAVPPVDAGNRTRAEGRHEATIVLLDARGRRLGEAAWVVEFRVENPT